MSSYFWIKTNHQFSDCLFSPNPSTTNKIRNFIDFKFYARKFPVLSSQSIFSSIFTYQVIIKPEFIFHASAPVFSVHLMISYAKSIEEEVRSSLMMMKNIFSIALWREYLPVIHWKQKCFGIILPITLAFPINFSITSTDFIITTLEKSNWSLFWLFVVTYFVKINGIPPIIASTV